MKKKFLLAAVLVGALSLGSCVDNNESASVIAVRNAKAEQLSGLAKLADAQAQAALIQANAEAELNQALAAFNNAKTEQEKAQAQIAMAKAQAEVARIAAQSEIDLINLKTQAIAAQAAYEQALLNQGNANVNELTTLFNAYKAASTNLVNAQIRLNQAKITLAKYEAALINDSELRATELAELNEQIAEKQQQILADSAKIEVFQKYTNTAEAQAAYDAALAQQTELNQTWQKAQQASSTAYQAYIKAGNTLRNSSYVQDINTLKNENIANIYLSIPSEQVNGRPSAADGNWCAVVNYNGKYTYIPLFEAIESSSEEIKYSQLEGQQTSTMYYTVYETYYEPIAGGFDVYMDSINAYVERNYGAPLADAKKAYTAAQKTLADAEKALADAGKDATQAQKDAVTAAKAAADAALTAQNQAEDALADMNEEVAEVAALIASIEAGADANAANVKAFNEASLANANASIAANQAYAVYDDNRSEVSALYTILTNSQSVDNQITNLENDIKSLKQDIANLQARIIEVENSTDAADDVAQQKQIIADLELQISVLQQQVDTTKATLEAAINAGSEE